jgi:hypothetical protein
VTFSIIWESRCGIWAEGGVVAHCVAKCINLLCCYVCIKLNGMIFLQKTVHTNNVWKFGPKFIVLSCRSQRADNLFSILFSSTQKQSGFLTQKRSSSPVEDPTKAIVTMILELLLYSLLSLNQLEPSGFEGKSHLTKQCYLKTQSSFMLRMLNKHPI